MIPFSSRPLLQTCVASILMLCGAGAVAQPQDRVKFSVQVDQPAGDCPAMARFTAVIAPGQGDDLQYRFVGSDGAATPLSKVLLNKGERREIVHVRSLGRRGDASVKGWLDLEYGTGDATRKARAEYAFKCRTDDRRVGAGPVLAKTALLDSQARGKALEENLLEEFGDRYLDRRGISLKRPFDDSRLKAYERLKEMRRALDKPHRPAEWRDGPGGPGAPGVLDPNQCAWSSLGPTNINGRVTGIAVDPTNGSRIYVTTVGGIWRSTTAGRRWQRVSDDFLATIFASVAVNPSTPTEVFAGAGDPNYHSVWTGGMGIMRSTLSGDPASWSKVTPPALDSHVIYRILVDPSPPNNVYAATSAGVYIGTRAGATITFARLALFDAWTSDIAVDFSVTPRLVYAGVRQASATFGRGIWKYDGTTWNDRSTGIPTVNSLTMSLALAASSPSTLYAKVEANTHSLQGVYKTTTGAETPGGGGNAWASLPGASALNDSTYSWYNAAIAVDPADANIVWGGGIGIYRTANGGMTWPNVSVGPNAAMPVGVHADHHAVAFDPTNSKIVYVGNDGGIFKSTDTSASWNWNDISHGMILTEFYRATSQQAMASIMAGGTQDNGTVLSFGNRTWYQPGGCDGADVAIDAANASTLYGNCNGGLYELANPVPGTVGGGAGITWTVPAGVSISSPLVTDDAVAGGALAAGWTQATVADPKIWHVLKTTDGTNWNDVGPTLGANVQVTAIGIASSSAFMTYYVAVSTGAVWRTTTGGAPWTNASGGLPVGYIGAIYVDPANAARALAATNSGVFLTVDSGTNWSPINGTGASALPTPTILRAVFDPSNANTAYLATYIGAFRGTITPAAGATPASAAWTPFNEGLPDGLDINDLWVNRTAKALKIGTMGHGAYHRDIRPGIACPGPQLLVRDNIYDRGVTPSPSGVPDPEHPIPDPARPGFYKPDDTSAGRVFWWQSADVRIDVPTSAPVKNQIPNADHVEAQTCPIHLSDCPAGSIRDADPQRGQAARVYVNVSNMGLLSASNVRVTALFGNANGGLPSLPGNFWSTTFPAIPALPAVPTCGALDTSTGWQFADPANPCPVIPVVNPDLPEVARFNWSVPMGQSGHSCMLVIVESLDDPIDASIRMTNETNVNTLVPNHRHVSLRNLHVIDASPAPAGGGAPRGMEPMQVGNPGDKARRIELLVSRAGLPRDAVLSLILPTREGVSVKGARLADAALLPDDLKRVRELKLDPKATYRITDPLEASFVIDMPANSNWVVGWAYQAGKLEAGTSGRWTVLERADGKVLGGNSYFLRSAARAK